MAEPLPKYLYCTPFFLAATAFVLAFVGTSCHYINFTDAGTGTDLHFGYWYYQSWSVSNSTTSNSTNTDSIEEIQGESCKLYPSNVNVDSSWQAARVFNLIVIILGGSVLLLDMFQGCMSTKRNVSFRLGSIGYFICSICAAFSLLLLDSNVCKNNTLIEELNGSAQVSFQETCSISRGGKSAIAATVLFFAAAVGNALLHPVKKEKRDDGLDEPLVSESSVV